MIKKSMSAIGSSGRDFFRGWRTMAVFHLLYAALLVSLYLFVLTRESSLWQLILTAFLAVAAPILFLLLQTAASLRYTRNQQRPLRLVLESLNTFWKLLVVSIPVILLAILAVYLFNKLQARFPVTPPAAGPPHAALLPLHKAEKPPVPFSWIATVFASLRLLILGVALPLTAVHLWIATARDGLVSTFQKFHRILGRAFSSESIAIYAIGLIVFGLMPYFLIFTRTPLKNGWAELIIFGLRLALTFVFTLWGWIVTLGALASITAPQTGVAAVPAVPATPSGPPAPPDPPVFTSSGEAIPST
jgi:hypothetical protein